MDQTVFFGHEQQEGRKRHRPTLTSVEVREAKAVCAQCPVKQQCLEHALEFDERHGIWGGTTPTERRVMANGHDSPNGLGMDNHDLDG